MEVKNFINLCDELISTKLLFADKKINYLLEAVASTPEVYELLSDCMNSFNKEREFEKAFTKDAQGNKIFVMPKEEYKVLALVFCLLADIGKGKLQFNQLILDYFSEDGRLDGTKFMQTVIVPFKNLISEAFGIKEDQADIEQPEKEILMSEVEEEELSPQQRLKVVPFPIERASNYLKDPSGVCQTFIMAKDVAVEIVERLEQERLDEQKRDCMLICHCIIIACIEQDFDLLNGLVCGIKYAGKGVKAIRQNLRELDDIINRQINHESKF